MSTPPAAEKTIPGSTPRWGMVIDVNRCVGCQTCTIACKHANDTPPDVQWRKVIDVEQGTFPDVERFFLVTGCQHCAEPPCVPVCPTGATRQREDGLVTMAYDECIGCGYCAVSCPYQARTIVHEERGYFGALTRQEKATAHPDRIGVAQKCTFCKERIDGGLARGLTPGVDPEATPACSSSCISQAIHFGDFRNPASSVARLIATQPSVQLNAEAGTDPQIRYLYSTPAVPGRESAGAAAALDNDDPSDPTVGKLQTLWDWRAAMNWIFGGVGAGLASVAGFAAWFGAIPAARLPMIHLIAATLMSVGLFCVFLKIGRHLRFWRAALRPQSSWMSRELYAAMVFFPAVLASLLSPGVLPSALATLGAAAFLVCQAMILWRARGIPAWRSAHIPWLIVASGLAEGWAALVLLVVASGEMPPRGMLGDGLLLVAAVAFLWLRYLGRDLAGVPARARRVLREVTMLLVPIGHLGPIALLGLALVVPSLAGPSALAAAAGVLVGGAVWKFRVIVHAGFFQGFHLPQVPQRGSGHRAAPARMDASGLVNANGPAASGR